METLWASVLFLNVQPSCDGKLLLFGYEAEGNSHDGTWVTASVKREYSEMDSQKSAFWPVL